MDKFELERRITALKKDIEIDGLVFKEKTVIDIRSKDGKPIASVFPEEQYVHFYDEFTQLGSSIPCLKKLIFGNYSNNHT